MDTRLTFKGVCDFIAKEHRDLLGDANVLTTAAMLLSAAIIGPGAGPLGELINRIADALSVKDQIAAMGKAILYLTNPWPNLWDMR